MSDTVGQDKRSEMMSRIRGKDTKPEMIVRRITYGLGFRYRLHARDLPGKPDLVFRGKKKVIFVHGCFWHQHGGCKNAHVPLSNTDYWGPKLRRNVERDAKALQELDERGWMTLTVWECETADPSSVARRVSSFLDS